MFTNYISDVLISLEILVNLIKFSNDGYKCDVSSEMILCKFFCVCVFFYRTSDRADNWNLSMYFINSVLTLYYHV